MRFLLPAALFVLAPCALADVSAIYGKCLPSGTVRDGRPTFSWKLTPTGGGHVTGCEMFVNGRRVVAKFNEQASAVEYIPAQALPSGIYSVLARATIERSLILRQDWTFEIDSDTNRSGPSYSASAAFETTNDLREQLGLPAFTMDGRINSAAEAHSRYQVLNHETGHYEVASKPGYTGKAPWDRIQAFGFNDVCYEGTCSSIYDPRKAIRVLFDAPYHRIPFLQPGTAAVGVGSDSGVLTIDFALSRVEAVGMSPAPDQTDIPLDWDGNESPSPLSVHHASGPVGYPIVFGWFTPKLEQIRVSAMRLTRNGVEVPCYLNIPGNDPELRFAAVLTPKVKLSPGVKYTVQVAATTVRGKKLDRTWSFTTAGS